MKFLLSNDDGIDAPGLAAMRAAVEELGGVQVVAPEGQLSSCGHQVNHHRPLRVRQIQPAHYAVDGTPAECVRLGLLNLASRVDWVLAGINAGANLGVDVYMSGTVAAAREAALLGKPAIAFSQYQLDGREPAWSHTIHWVRHVFRILQDKPLRPGGLWNVNFPDVEPSHDVPEVIFCPLESGHLPVSYELLDGEYHYRGLYHDRPRIEGSDVDVCFGGKISVTQLLPFV